MRTNFFETEQTSRRTSRSIVLGLAIALTTSVLLLVLQVASEPAHAADPITVDRSGDPDLTATPTAGNCTAATTDDCTLRGAITAADSTPGAGTINFAIPGSGVKTILVQDPRRPANQEDQPRRQALIITPHGIANGAEHRHSHGYQP